MSPQVRRTGALDAMPVSELVQLPIDWMRGKDARFIALVASLAGGSDIREPVRVLVCGCGQTYLLDDGGHRISAAFDHFKRTGEDLRLPVERLAQEHAAVGFYLSGHPLDDYQGALRREGVLSHADLLRKAAGSSQTVARIAGSVAARDERKSARGNRFAFVRLSDPTGLYEVRVFSDVLDASREHLEPGRSVVLTVEATLEGDEMKLLARGVQPIDIAVAGAANAGLRIYVNDAAAGPSLATRLADIARGGGKLRRGPVELVLVAPDLDGEVGSAHEVRDDDHTADAAGEAGDAELEKAIGLMARHGAIGDTIGRARHFGEIARDALAPLPPTRQKSALLDVIESGPAAHQH